MDAFLAAGLVLIVGVIAYVVRSGDPVPIADSLVKAVSR